MSFVQRPCHLVWLVKDLEGFLQAVTHSDFHHPWWAAQVLVRLMPEKAAEMLSGPAYRELNDFSAGILGRELAESHPALYLNMNPEGTCKVVSGHGSGYNDWETAITSLAKTDALAAGNACLRWKGENDPGTISQVLLAVAAAWKSGNPSFKEWVAGIEDPKLRNFASHARLCALAEKDPKAALAELYSAKLEEAESIDAPSKILTQLAKVNLVAALKLVQEVEGMFSQTKWDPFADPSTEGKTANPFSHLYPGRYSASGDEVEDNGVRHAVLGAAVGNLPDDPAQFIAAMHKLSAEMGGGDALWQCGVEDDMIRLKCVRWSVEECLTAAVQRAAESNASQDDATLQKLATRMARADPEQALAALQQFPEQARSSLVSEIIKQLPPSDPARRIALTSIHKSRRCRKANKERRTPDPPCP